MRNGDIICSVCLLIMSELFCLCPKLDENEVISLNCVLQYAEFLQHDVSHPIVLPHKCWHTTYCITTPAYVKILS